MAAESTVMTPISTITIIASNPIDTLTKNGRPVWKSVRPIQYMMSDATKTRESLFLKVEAKDLNILLFEGSVSTNSFSLRRNVGSSIQTSAIAASTMNGILYPQAKASSRLERPFLIGSASTNGTADHCINGIRRPRFDLHRSESDAMSGSVTASNRRLATVIIPSIVNT